MQIKNIENMPISSILKNNLYLNGIIVSDKLFEKLKSSQYKGYTTTTGIFMKLGATLSRQEFEKQKEIIQGTHYYLKFQKTCLMKIT